MSPETITQYGTYFDDALFLIGGALLAIELLKGWFSGSMKGRALLDMVQRGAALILVAPKRRCC